MEQIKETIKNQNPLLKDTSIDHYAKSIFRLHQAMVGKDEPILKYFFNDNYSKLLFSNYFNVAIRRHP